MKIYKLVKIDSEELVSIQCDKCKKNYDDVLEILEFHHISFIAGFGSVWGDGDKISGDLCQHCLKEFAGTFLKVEEYL